MAAQSISPSQESDQELTLLPLGMEKALTAASAFPVKLVTAWVADPPGADPVEGVAG